MAHHINDHEPVTKPAVLSDAQFEKLVALLQPGYELSTLMLADYKARMAVGAPPADPPPDAPSSEG